MQCDFETIVREEMPQAVRLASLIKKNFNPEMVIDVGCGPGIYTAEMIKIGIDAIGIDSDSRANVKGCSEQYELLTDKKFSLAICLEVAEHIEPELAGQFVERLCRAADTVLFSAAHPGQGGIGHINCQPKEYWIERFNINGFVLDEPETASIVHEMLAGPHMGWFVMNAMVFKKKNAGGSKMRFHIPGTTAPRRRIFLFTLTTLRSGLGIMICWKQRYRSNSRARSDSTTRLQLPSQL